MDEHRNERLLAVFREHPALIVSAFYVAASMIGMFWSWAHLRNFGINVFNYAQISDFLLVSIKEPLTWVLVALSVVLVMIDNAHSRRVERRGKTRWFRWYGTERYRFINNVGAVAIIAVFILAFANLEAAAVKRGEGKRVEVTYAAGGEPRSAVLLGTTGQFLFLFDPLTGRVDVHPFEAVHSISTRIG